MSRIRHFGLTILFAFAGFIVIEVSGIEIWAGVTMYALGGLYIIALDLLWE